MKFRYTDGVGGWPRWHGAVTFFSLFISLAFAKLDGAAIDTMMMVMMIYFHSFIILFKKNSL